MQTSLGSNYAVWLSLILFSSNTCTSASNHNKAAFSLLAYPKRAHARAHLHHIWASEALVSESKNVSSTPPELKGPRAGGSAWRYALGYIRSSHAFDWASVTQCRTQKPGGTCLDRDCGGYCHWHNRHYVNPCTLNLQANCSSCNDISISLYNFVEPQTHNGSLFWNSQKFLFNNWPIFFI